MDLQTLTTVFMWCTIINGGILILVGLFCAFAILWHQSNCSSVSGHTSPHVGR